MTDRIVPGCSGETLPGGARRVSVAPPVPEIVRHVTLALCGYVRRLRQEGQCPPPEVEDFTAFLVRFARVRQDAPLPADGHPAAQHVPVPARLLVTKGEAAERLGVSVRTIERLVATGRLRQVHVERLARFRVSDLEAYVDGLGEIGGTDPENHDDQLDHPRCPG